MTPERWKRIEELFHAAVELSPGERAAFVARECAGDAELEKEITRLLAGDAKRSVTLEEVVAAEAAKVADGAGPRLRAGDRLGRYTIVELLGEGGMGSVYAAHDETLNRKLALKVVRPRPGAGGSDATTRLLREARAAAALTHPNIVAIYDVGDINGTSFIAMELVSGKTLRERLAEPVDTATKLAWLRAIARAIEAAHARGIVHRDIKPQNVMITDEGGVKVLDFGIARGGATPVDPAAHTAKAGLATLTLEGSAIGTPMYMAPEQLQGKRVDERADQFAWAVVAYEVLAGRVPWSTNSAMQLAAEIASVDPPPLEAPPPLGDVVRRALAKSPDARFASMTALLAALDGKSVPARRHRLWLALAIGVCASVLGIALVWPAGDRSAGSTPPPAAPPSQAPIVITDLPVPKSQSLEAIAAYRAGMQASRDGDTSAMARSFERASQLDPTMAMAFARFADVTFGTGRVAAAHAAFERAWLLRTSLDAHDLAWLEAEEPLFRRSPPDFDECARRELAIARARPQDSEAQLNAGFGAFARGNYAAAREHARRALELDPQFGSARVVVVMAFENEGRASDAEAAIRECARESPGASDCQGYMATLYASTGACDDYERTAGQNLAAHPDAVSANDMRASALAHRGASVDMLRAAMAQTEAAFSDPIAANAQHDVLDLWLGDFASVLAHRSEREHALNTTQEAHVAARLAHSLVTTLSEVGQDREAGKVAMAFVARRPLLVDNATFDSAERDESVFVLAAAGATGAMSDADRIKTRDAWFDARTKAAATTADRTEIWLLLYGAAAQTREDAERAVASWPADAAIHRELDDMARGHVYALLERWDVAIPPLERVAQACDVLVDVAPRVRAHMELARGYAATHDTARACEQYRWVIDRWGNAKPRSVTAAEAKSRSRALGCPAH